MKKILLILFTLIGGATAAYSQMYIGGSVNIATKTDKIPGNQGTNKTTHSAFHISPRIGYQLGERTSVGISIGFYSAKASSPYNEVADSDIAVVREQNNRYYTVAPFVRYDFVRIGKFALAGDTSAGYGWYKEQTKITSNSSSYMSRIFVSFKPVLTLDISRRITLEAQLDFISLNYSRNHYWSERTAYNISVFNFGFDSGNIITPGNLTFGMIYRF